MDITVGKKVGIGHIGSKRINLYCKVESVSTTATKLYVINGNWDLTLLPNGYGIVHGAPSGDYEIQGIEIIFTGRIPKGLGYNEAINFMNKRLASSWITRYLSDVKMSMVEKRRKFSKAVSAGYKGFRNVYQPEKKLYWDDDIPTVTLDFFWNLC